MSDSDEQNEREELKDELNFADQDPSVQFEQVHSPEMHVGTLENENTKDDKD